MKKRILSMITALALSLSLLPTTALATAEEGTEAAGSVYASGTQMQDGEDEETEHTHTGQTYTALESKDNLVLSAGNYYLLGDLSTAKTLTIKDEVKLCLNGHTLSLAAGAEGPLFQIEKDGKLTLCDCEGGGKLAELADVLIAVPESETFKIQELHLPIYHCLCLMLEEYFFQ